ncbi:MAG: MATE family efflux transporter [Planctomycetota bacterium]|jgi:MATE family multidrug resistance protein
MSHESTSHPEPALASPRPLAEVWRIAWPTVLTMTSYTVMQFIDKLMVGQVGPLEVAAQGNGGIWAFTPIAVAMGFLTVVNTYVSQNLGAGRKESAPKYAWAALWMSAGIWLVFLLPIALVLPWLFAWMHDPATVSQLDRLVELEAGYGRILLAGAILTLAGRSMHHYFFGLHRPKIITLSAIVGNLTNVVANYVLIFGEGGIPALGLPGVPGMPAMGLYGAAWGTVIGTAVEVCIPMAIFLGPRMNRELATRRAWRPRLAPMRDLTRIGWPAAVQYGNELICWSLFMTVLVGEFGEDHMTAGWIALGYMHLSFMPAVGFSVAVTSIVGKYIGAGEPDTAVARARLGLLLAVGYMTVCAVLFFVLRRPLIAAFVGGPEVTAEQSARIIEIGAKLLICAAVFQTVDAFGIIYTGALRGAGDTVWPGVVTMIYSWAFIVGAGWLMIWYFPQLESIGPWIAASLYIILFGITMCIRFERGRWRSIRLLTDLEHDAAQVAPIGPAPPAIEGDASIRDIAEVIADEVAARESESESESEHTPEPGGWQPAPQPRQ